jgi:hypothetical protein
VLDKLVLGFDDGECRRIIWRLCKGMNFGKAVLGALGRTAAGNEQERGVEALARVHIDPLFELVLGRRQMVVVLLKTLRQRWESRLTCTWV